LECGNETTEYFHNQIRPDWLKNPLLIVLVVFVDFCFSCTNLFDAWAIGLDQQPQVPYCSARRVPEHAGSGIAHHLTYLLAIIGFVAVDRAFGTNRLIGDKLAAFQPLVGISLQLAALLTQALFVPVFIPAVQTKHERDRFFLSVQNFFSHEATILAHLQNIAPIESGQYFFLSV
jgi:hypothetical protein